MNRREFLQAAAGVAIVAAVPEVVSLAVASPDVEVWHDGVIEPCRVCSNGHDRYGLPCWHCGGSGKTLVFRFSNLVCNAGETITLNMRYTYR